MNDKNKYNGLEIAVVGMSGRFPGANNINEFWQNLKNGVESITFFTDKELIEEGIPEHVIKKSNYVKAKGHIEKGDYFDAGFFGYSPKEAEFIEPQLRIFHECVWEVLENANIVPDNYKGLIGLYAGKSPNSDWDVMSGLLNYNKSLEQFEISTLNNNICTLLSYKLNLKGPSFTLYTACSTSLVAIHLASQGLLNGECDAAIAGGVSLFPLKSGYIYQEGMINSPDGHCRPFDADAKGTVFGNGVGLVVLKRLEDALRDNDHIYAIIKGSAINNDGIRKVGYTAPSIEGQIEVISSAQQMAEIEAESISYIETHGTGTVLGDPVEFEALKSVFGNSNKKCGIGSVKSNIGHLDTAAGVAGFIKTCLSLYYKQIPPSLNFNKPNPKLNIENSPFYINTKLQEWKNEDSSPLRAGISAFGIGGTNAHVILEEAPERKPSVSEKKWELITLSANSETSLNNYAKVLCQSLKDMPEIDLGDLAYTLNIGRKNFEYKRKLVCSNLQDVITALSSENTDSEIVCSNNDKKKVVFMFTGQGAQYTNMALGLYKNEKVFKTEVDRCFELIAPYIDYDLKGILFPDANAEINHDAINNTRYSQPLLFIVEYALAKQLMHLDIKPFAMIGHSIGEYVAACLSGVFSLEDALKLVLLRGSYMQSMPAGDMISVNLSEEKFLPFLNEGVNLAAVNAPELAVLSGDHESISQVSRELKTQGHHFTLLRTSHAFHSWMMNPILDKFKEQFDHIKLNTPKIPFLSNVSGTWISIEQATNPSYWVEHLRKTVRFSEAIKTLLKKDKENYCFIEVGPGKTLSTFITQHIDNYKNNKVTNFLRLPNEGVDDDYYFINKLSELWQHGIRINWEKYYSSETRSRISLPSYVFDKQKHDRVSKAVKGEKFRNLIKNLMANARQQKVSDWFYVPGWIKSNIPEYPSNKIDTTNAILIFADPSGLGEKFGKSLQKIGCDVIYIQSGKQFSRKNSTYLINVESKQDYQKLFEEIRKTNKSFDHVFHFWNITDQDFQQNIDHKPLKKFLDYSYYSILYIAQELTSAIYVNRKIKLITFSNNIADVIGNEQIIPIKSVYMGLLKVIPQESSNIRCKNIDVPSPYFEPEEEKHLFNQVLNELNPDNKDTVIAYRNKSRWVQSFTPSKSAKSQSLHLRKNGVYIITGGVGNISFTLSKYLAEQYNATIILIGRTPIPERQLWDQMTSKNQKEERVSEIIKKIRKIEDAGGAVRYFAADVSDESAMGQIITEVEKEFKNINGLIHGAGIIEGHTLDLVNFLNKELCEQQFTPKIYGTIVLGKLLQNKKLDFCILMSSVSSIIGGLRFGAYAAANTFMDYFVKNQDSDDVKWMSINWDGWANTSLNKGKEENQHFDELIIQPEEGGKALEEVLLFAHEKQIVASLTNLDARIKKWIEFENISLETEHTDDGNKEQDTQTTFKDKQDILVKISTKEGLEKELCLIWQDFFGRKSCNVNDDFFELGGDSLKALSLINIIHKELNLIIPVAVFFSKTTIAEMAGYLINIDTKTYSSISTAQNKDYYTLSSAQLRLCFLQLLEKDNTSYNETQIALIEGQIDQKKLKESFKTLIQRHEILRTSIELVNGEPKQKIHSDIDFDYEFDKIQEDNIESSIKDFIQPFDLHQAPLFRAKLMQISEGKNILVIDIHHIITDGTSIALFIRELMAIYAGNALPELKLQYKDYAEWQNSDEQKAIISQQEKFWLDKFKDEIVVPNLPVDYTRPITQSFEGNTLHFKLDANDVNKIRSLIKSEETSLFMFLLSTLNILFAKLWGQDDIIIGTPMAGRNHHDLKNLMGNFTNTLVFRNYPSPDKKFADFLNDVKQSTLEVFENKDYAYESLVEKVVKNRDMSRNPLFDVMFNLQNYNLENIGVPSIEIEGLKIRPYAHKIETTKFDITIQASEGSDEIFFLISYGTRIFKQSTIERLIQYYKQVVTSCLENKNLKISEINILTAEEKQKLLFEFNSPSIDFPKDKTIQQIFEEQVEKTPENYSVVFEEEKLTYRELNIKANQVAHFLRTKGVTANTIVAIMVERSLDMIIGMLGILKAGGTYLPIVPNYPEDRIKFIFEDSKASILLTQSKIKEKIREKGFNIELIDIESEELFEGEGTNLKNINQPADAAYIIYTSGTTGRPKGSIIEHKNVVRLLFNDNFQFDFSQHDVWTMFHAYNFDFSVWEMYGALLYGGQLIVLSDSAIKDPGYFLNILSEKNVTVLNQTPQAFYQLISEELKRRSHNLKIKYIIFGGEALSPSKLKDWYDIYPDVKLINMYGITETTVHVTYKEITYKEIQDNISNIGKPIPTLQTYIMDQNMQLLPIGVAGELCVAGEGLGRGYLNNPELTSQKFVPNPYNKNGLLYRSGDLAKILENGDMEYLGRIDNQVKIRGFRIELGEVENQLLKFEGIDEAVVMVQEKDNNKYLCAYLKTTIELSINILRDHLIKAIPDYMVPAYFIKVDNIPLTANGKVDRKALLKYEGVKLQTSHTYIAPESDIEKVISEAWKEILNVDKVGIDDNFFELGGTSIDIIKLSEKLKFQFDKKDLVMTIFRFPTIRSIANYFNQSQNLDSTVVATTDDVPKQNLNRKKQVEMRRKLRENE